MKHLFVFTLLFLISCGEPSTVQTLQGDALGTTYSIKYFLDDGEIQTQQIDSLLNVINTSMSTYIQHSDISKINSGDTTIVVDDHFKQVFETSKKIYKDTDGYFDPSVGLLVNAYGFGPEGYSEEVSDQEIDSLHQYVGFHNIQLRPDRIVTSNSDILYLDFNAIAKGYTVDVFADYLKSKGSQNFLVEIGGEVVVFGENLDNNRPWKVGIEMPLEDGSRELKYGVNLNNEALATSGNYRKYRVDPDTGFKYVHTINPKTGRSQKSDILSASVIANTCAEADAYATAFMAMGLQKAKEFLTSGTGLKVIFIYSDENGNQKSFTSKDLKDSIDEF
ncbi:FAD:protein FMN transferase [Psychroflexus montanilacus]|uniref:FAD:protein FMN transferase n=1 Tax=Psychroflexus montanilacus TaxID=2873598 RepID=UPI001CCD17F5|nr:FAD:protein FMN transferase [Psychroflexus montanilacus]MBZ9651329.1 FAD:protein FMN transferase [Psychroflexus montanilacus]